MSPEHSLLKMSFWHDWMSVGASAIIAIKEGPTLFFLVIRLFHRGRYKPPVVVIFHGGPDPRSTPGFYQLPLILTALLHDKRVYLATCGFIRSW